MPPRARARQAPGGAFLAPIGSARVAQAACACSVERHTRAALPWALVIVLCAVVEQAPRVLEQRLLLPPSLGWARLAHMQDVVATRPDVAFAVHRLSLMDQLELTLDLCGDADETGSELPNVVRFRPRKMV